MSVCDLIKYLKKYPEWEEIGFCITDAETGRRFFATAVTVLDMSVPAVHLEVTEGVKISGSAENVEEE